MASAPGEVPSHFLCPISLQLMREPVTLPTGISYDRAAIIRWLAAPHLRRRPHLPGHALARVPLTRGGGRRRRGRAAGPVPGAEVAALLSDAAAAQVEALKRLRELVAECEDNRAVLESQDGVFDALSRVVSSADACSTAREEAVGVLASLRIPEPELAGVVARHSNLGEALTAVLRSSNLKSRANAALLVRSLSEAAWPAWVIGLSQELLAEVVRVVRDRVSTQATKAALHALAALCPYGRTRVKIVGAGAVPAIVDLLLDDPERRVNEIALVALDRLCKCAEGRAELVAHAAGLAVVGKKVLRVSEAASEAGGARAALRGAPRCDASRAAGDGAVRRRGQALRGAAVRNSAG
ncbi:unnamed protein product [Miscanthus lutarioriparius]|uniref:U-box domain-containing protein n=1 Tax=Miscanthus lutarioriparius TaxID=422564 RepID=A0A811SRS0_9POAL|nr:unnamed protein product [Miscanthus lutarioriparius]